MGLSRERARDVIPIELVTPRLPLMYPHHVLYPVGHPFRQGGFALRYKIQYVEQ